MTREEAKNWLNKLYANADITDEYGDMVDMQPYSEAIDMAIKALEQTGWIPVSERLPSDNEYVIVSVLDDHGDTPWKYTSVAWLCNGVWISDNDILCGTVVAWMSLPQPYKGESEDGK